MNIWEDSNNDLEWKKELNENLNKAQKKVVNKLMIKKIFNGIVKVDLIDMSKKWEEKYKQKNSSG